MIKILYIITGGGLGGAQKYVTDLANNLDKNQFKTETLFGGLGIESEKIKHLSNTSGFLFKNDFMTIYELVKIYKEKDPNIIHLNSSKAGVLGALAAFFYNLSNKQKIKVVFTAHGWVFNPDNEISIFLKYFYIFLHKFAALFQDKIICVSQFDYNLAIKYKITKKNKLSVIHNGINTDKINPISKELARSEITKKIISSSTSSTFNSLPFWIGSLGRLVKEKNYQTFIKAAAFVPNAHFFIIGDGSQYNELQNLINQLTLQNRIKIIKNISAQQGNLFINGFDVFVMSSIKEGLPYALLETMSIGIPCVVTDAGGMPEAIKSGINGLVAPKRNPKALAEAIKKILDNKDLAQKFSEEAKKTITDNFTLMQMLSKTQKVYLEL